jgi:hypothetical protein
MLYNELEQGDILSGVRLRLALRAYTDILLCSIWAIRRIRQTPVPYIPRRSYPHNRCSEFASMPCSLPDEKDGSPGEDHDALQP